jgi:hypothetical protein
MGFAGRSTFRPAFFLRKDSPMRDIELNVSAVPKWAWFAAGVVIGAIAFSPCRDLLWFCWFCFAGPRVP